MLQTCTTFAIAYVQGSFRLGRYVVLSYCIGRPSIFQTIWFVHGDLPGGDDKTNRRTEAAWRSGLWMSRIMCQRPVQNIPEK
eukprot:3087333-Amphidinium_carterae.1